MAAEINDESVTDENGVRTADLETWMRKSLRVDYETSKVYVRVGRTHEDVITAFVDQDGDLILQIAVPDGWENGEDPIR